MQALAAKVSRALFLLILFLDFFAIVGTFSEAQPNIEGMILGSIILIVIGLGFRVLALRSEKKWKPGPSASKLVCQDASKFDSGGSPNASCPDTSALPSPNPGR
jgi:hypothetical protein